MIPTYLTTTVCSTTPSPRWWGCDDPQLSLAAIRRQVTQGAARALRVPEDAITLVEQRHHNGVSVQAVYWPSP
ncbi:MAG: hypothetical protein AB7G23_20225 [Vicinamibacterales bacterium]